MRYMLGVFIGALLPGIVFMGSAVINALGYGVTDPVVLQSLWSLFLGWVFVSALILVVPPIAVYFARRQLFREFFFYEFGGLAFFSPFWIGLAAEVSGTPWVEVFTSGVRSGLPSLGPDGTLIGTDIGAIVLTPLMIASLVVGLLVLRPSLILRMSGPGVATEALSAVETVGATPAPSTIEGAPAAVAETPSKAAKASGKAAKAAKPISKGQVDSEMPGVSAPVADDTTIAELRVFLSELSVPEMTINAIINAGIATVTDLVSTGTEQFVSVVGLDRKTAQDLYVAIQKKAWYGGL
ncbi:MAG: helix-hairpin-helix domain-containing protein [Candidatus Thorarchaeota archaeon]|nr:helix-hairpin-helix domain-containing protein [Candidatus Thorarchaeota archaeon]